MWRVLYTHVHYNSQKKLKTKIITVEGYQTKITPSSCSAFILDPTHFVAES